MAGDLRVQCPTGLVVRSWDEGLSVVYCPSNGMTVLVTDEAGTVLNQVRDAAAGLRFEADAVPEVVNRLLHAGLLARVE